MKGSSIFKAALALLAAIVVTALIFYMGGGLLFADSSAAELGVPNLPGLSTLLVKAQDQESVPVIVGLDLPGFELESLAVNPQILQLQQAAIAEAQVALLGRLSAHNVMAVKRFDYVPALASTSTARASGPWNRTRPSPTSKRTWPCRPP